MNTFVSRHELSTPNFTTSIYLDIGKYSIGISICTQMLQAWAQTGGEKGGLDDTRVRLLLGLPSSFTVYEVAAYIGP